ncbi:MAG TPA: hypothetical protein VEA35_06300, partial [Ramlibacter sp.]|nr:hypothetical protein [Ramlibacter sp.]
PRDTDRDGVPPEVETTLANLVAREKGAQATGDLNGDGVRDEDQNALATLAWTTVDKFIAAIEGTLTETRPIISLSIVETMQGSVVDASLQLSNVQVLPPDSPIVGGEKPSGPGLEVPWDPIRFTVEPLAAGGALADANPRAAGTQVRVLIDISRSGLPEGYFNGYMKYVSAQALAGGPLADLDGQPITAAGWYDFTRRGPEGNGARFVVENGSIVAIELLFTDNQFGDDSPAGGFISDPGVPVRRIALPVAAPVLPPPVLEPRELPPVASRPPEPLAPAERWVHQPLRFDSALHPLQALAQLDEQGLTEPVESRLSWRAAAQALMGGDTTERTAADNEWKIATLGAGSPSLALLRGMPDHAGVAESVSRFAVPADAFVHTDAAAQVQLSARLADGAALPGWVAFDPRTGVFTVKAPAGWRGDLAIVVLARDADGRQAEALFRIRIADKTTHRVADMEAQPPGRSSLSEQLRAAARLRQPGTAIPMGDLPLSVRAAAAALPASSTSHP